MKSSSGKISKATTKARILPLATSGASKQSQEPQSQPGAIINSISVKEASSEASTDSSQGTAQATTDNASLQQTGQPAVAADQATGTDEQVQTQNQEQDAEPEQDTGLNPVLVMLAVFAGLTLIGVVVYVISLSAKQQDNENW